VAHIADQVAKSRDCTLIVTEGDSAKTLAGQAQDDGVSYSDFINRELELFSQYDDVRSIPHLLDGFKPSQRKVLHACSKKKLKTEIKVAQLAGYIGEHSAYHQGDMSLNGTIIGMAQNYCGSNASGGLPPLLPRHCVRPCTHEFLSLSLFALFRTSIS
jgi:hypothetical protein